VTRTYMPYRTCPACNQRHDLAAFASNGGACLPCRAQAAARRRYITPENEAVRARVLDAVAAAYEVTPLSIIARDRDPNTVETRKVAIRVLWDMDLGVSVIGRLIGVDHSTVLHHLGGFRRATETEKWGVREVRTALGLRRRPLPQTARPRRRVGVLREQTERLEATAS